MKSHENYTLFVFFLRKPKNYQSGNMPIYLRITIDGQRTELAVSRKFDPDR
ncbi:MAG TPA: Arm DNA-binding domain-containing protein [Mucilaginibacter sp.]